MKPSFKVATVPAVSSILVCAIARLVVGVADSTPALQGYSIGVIAIIAYLGIVASLKKQEWEATHPIGEQTKAIHPLAAHTKLRVDSGAHRQTGIPHDKTALSVGHLCNQLAHPGQPITSFYRLVRTTKSGTDLMRAYLRTKEFGLQDHGTPHPVLPDLPQDRVDPQEDVDPQDNEGCGRYRPPIRDVPLAWGPCDSTSMMPRDTMCGNARPPKGKSPYLADTDKASVPTADAPVRQRAEDCNR